jgi:phenylacetate-CoA ligase
MQLRQFLYLASLIKAGHVSERLFFQELARNQWASPEEVRVAQDEALRRLLLHAYDQVPYYRQIIDEVGGREAIASSDPRDVVKNFPLLTKQLIREHWEDIKSRDLASRKWYYNTSGGSTGEPIRLVVCQF